MNPLLCRMPEALEVDGKEWPIRWDFRSGLRILLAFEDSRLTRREQAGIMLKVLYKEPPGNLPAALEQAVWFLNGGEMEPDSRGTASHGAVRLYSFRKDAAYIDSAFRRTYGIDLNTGTLHWWKFCRYFMDLDETCFFSRLVSLRERKAHGRLSAEERKALARLDGIASLPADYSAGELAQIEAFLRQVQ